MAYIGSLTIQTEVVAEIEDLRSLRMQYLVAFRIKEFGEDWRLMIVEVDK